MKDYRDLFAGAVKSAEYQFRNVVNRAYEQGYEDGKKIQEEEDAKIVSQITKQDMNDKKACEEQAYQKGLDDAWEACRKMEYMLFNEPQFKECFGDIDFYTVVTKKSASETLQKIREYEEKQTEKNCDNCAHDPETDDFSKYCKGCINSNNWQSKQDVGEIKIGDEVIFKEPDYPDTKGVVIQVDNKAGYKYPYNLMLDNGDSQWSEEGSITKTGRHFPEIEQVLKAMQG